MEYELDKNESSKVLIGLGKRIKALRRKKGWTQEKFAEIAKINDKEVSHIEAGKRNLTLITLIKISNAFDLLPYELLIEKKTSLSKET